MGRINNRIKGLPAVLLLPFLFSFTPSVLHGSNSTVLVGSGGNTFSPANLNVCLGDTLFFVWAGGIHNVHITNPASAPSADLTAPGDTFKYVPASSGNFVYQCDYHAPGMSGSFTVDEPIIVSNQPSNNTYCAGSNVMFSINATGTGITYQWQENQGSGFASLINDATYSGVTTPTLTITGASAGMNGYQYRCNMSGTCTPSTKSITVFLLLKTIPSVDLGTDVTQCGGSVLLDAGNPGSAFAWSTGASTQTVSVSTSDTVYVDVTNTCGSVSDTLVVTINPLPVISAGADASVCIGNPLTLTASGGVSYIWIVGGQTTTSIVVSPPVSAFYTVIGTGANGCTNTSTASVTVTFPGTLNTVSTPASCPVNNDGTVLATVTGGTPPFNYLWSTSPPHTTDTVTGLAPGSYSVTVTDAAGCSISAVEIVTGSAAILQTTFMAANRMDGNMFDITALSNILITDFDANLDDGTGSGSGGYMKIYYKAGTHAGYENNPSAWTFIDSVFVNPVASGVPTLIPVPVNITIPAGQTYAFYITGNRSGCDVKYSNGTAVGAVYSQDANLQIKEGVGKGYPFAATYSPRVWNGIVHYCRNASVGIEQDNAHSANVRLYPNPSNGRFVFQFPNETGQMEELKIEIHNVFGEVIFRQTVNREMETVSMNAPAGIYFYKVTSSSGTTGSGKIVIE